MELKSFINSEKQIIIISSMGELLSILKIALKEIKEEDAPPLKF